MKRRSSLAALLAGGLHLALLTGGREGLAQSEADCAKQGKPCAKQEGNDAKSGEAGAKDSKADAKLGEAEAKEAKADAKTIEVRVIGSSANALQKIPGSGQLVTQKEIARAQPIDVAEVLRRVPGVVVRQEQGAGLRLDISIRGLNGQRGRDVLVLEDGVPVANNPYGEPDLYYATPVERLRGVEVVKGSGAILYGPQTIGGVVNFLTIAPPEALRVHVSMAAGGPGQFELIGRYGDSFGDARYVAQIFGKRGDGARGEDYYATDAFAKLAVPISARSEITAKIGFHDEGANSSDLGLTQGMFDQDPRRSTLTPYDWAHLLRVDGSILHRMWLGDGVELATLAYATATSRVWRAQGFDRLPVPGVAYERIVGDVTKPLGAIYFRNTNTIRDRSYSVIGVEPRLTYKFTTAGIGHTLEIGARFLGETAHRAQSAGESSISEAGSLQTDEDDGSIALSGYVQDRIAFNDHLLVTPGFRFEYATQRRDIHRAFVDTAPRDVSIHGTNSFIAPLPGIGLVAGTPQIHGFGGVHVGFAAPRTATAISEGGVSERLDAERAIHYEAGVRAAPFKHLRGEATFFLSSFQNQIIPALRTGSATTDLVNAGQTRHLGVEVGARFEIGRALAIPFDLGLSASYTGLSARFVGGSNDGRSLPYAPEHVVSASVDAEHPIGLGAQVAWTFVGPQFADEANTLAADITGRVGQLPAYQMLDLSLRYTHKPTGLGATLAVKNALDEIYIASRRPDGVFPAGFRQILGSVRWTYDEAR